MTPEGKVKRKVAKLLQELKVYYFFPQTGGFGKSGVPDIVGCAYGRFFAIECKATVKNLPTELQLAQLGVIASHGGIVAVVDADNFKGWADGFATLVQIWKNAHG